MTSRTVTAVLAAPQERVFDYLSKIENLPAWASEFARELKYEDGKAKVVNGLGEFYFAIEADAKTGVIDMYAGPTEDGSDSSPRGSSACPATPAPSASRCSRRRGCPTSCLRPNISRCYASSTTFAANSARELTAESTATTSASCWQRPPNTGTSSSPSASRPGATAR